MAAKKTGARTKTETKKALQQVAAEAKSADSMDVSARTSIAEERKRVAEATAGISVDKVVGDLTGLELGLGRALAKVREEIVAKTKQLEDVRQAIAFADADLKSRYDIEVAAASLQNLLETHKEKEAELTEAIEEARKAWTKEQQAHELAIRERNEATERNRKREESEYQWSRDSKRRADEQMYAYNRDQREAELHKREETLKAMEGDVQELRNQLAAYPEMAKKEQASAVAAALGAQKRDLTHEFALKEKDYESRILIAANSLKQAETASQKLAEQVLALTTKLDAAQAQVVVVAREAVTGASGQLAMQKMQETIATQASGNGGRGKV